MHRHASHTKTMRRMQISGLTLLILVVLAGCRHHAASPDLKVLTIFSDFEFFGSVPYHGGKDAEPLIVESSEPKPFPKRLELGRAYVFRHRRPVDDEKLALSEIPSRLRNAGLEILQAPASSRDLIASYIGGPFFVIKFSDGQHTALITNRLSRDYTKQVDSGWEGEDYILFYAQ